MGFDGSVTDPSLSHVKQNRCQLNQCLPITGSTVSSHHWQAWKGPSEAEEVSLNLVTEQMQPDCNMREGKRDLELKPLIYSVPRHQVTNETLLSYFQRYKMTLFLLFLTVTNSSLPPKSATTIAFQRTGLSSSRSLRVSESPAMSEQCSAHHIGQASEHWSPPQDGLPKKEMAPAKRSRNG